MHRPHPVWILPCLILLVCPTARGEALRPSVARRVEENAPAITAELRDVIASTATLQGERLQGIVSADAAAWGIRYRDGHLLFSIHVNKNLTLREKRDGEIEARNLALVTLGQKFNRLLDLEDASQGLDPDAVRVIFIEPDALRAYGPPGASGAVGGYAGRFGWPAGIGAGFDACPGVLAAPPCGCQ